MIHHAVSSKEKMRMDRHVLNVALGNRPADLVVTNGQLVNVTSGEIYAGGVAVAGDRIAAIGD